MGIVVPPAEVRMHPRKEDGYVVRDPQHQTMGYVKAATSDPEGTGGKDLRTYFQIRVPRISYLFLHYSLYTWINWCIS